MSDRPSLVIGRYELHGAIAAGGMATVHYGRLLGLVGFSRTVAIKRLHPQYAKDPEFVAMFLDEARLAARIRHPNVVATLDVVSLDGELFVVMEYVQGESLGRLLRASERSGTRIPTRVVSSIAIGMLNGLHAAHEATTERGEPLGIVHRDVSPQNVLVGTDGVARILDFGVAKAATRFQVTREGQLKGKLGYMAPEQLRRMPIDRRTDVYAASVVLWEALTRRRLFEADDPGGIVDAVLTRTIESPEEHEPELSGELGAIVLRGLSRDPAGRFATAREMALALEAAEPLAGAHEVGEWVERIAREALHRRAEQVKELEALSIVTQVPAPERRELEGSTSSTGLSSEVEASIPPRSSRPNRQRALGAVAGMVVASVATLALTHAWDQEPAVEEAAQTLASPANPAPPEPAAPTAVPAESVTAPPEPLASSVPSAAIHPASRGVRSPSDRPRSPVPRASNTCNPGYYYDAEGLKVWKPECLPRK